MSDNAPQLRLVPVGPLIGQYKRLIQAMVGKNAPNTHTSLGEVSPANLTLWLALTHNRSRRGACKRSTGKSTKGHAAIAWFGLVSATLVLSTKCTRGDSEISTRAVLRGRAMLG
jgi:hypothetical protein